MEPFIFLSFQVYGFILLLVTLSSLVSTKNTLQLLQKYIPDTDFTPERSSTNTVTQMHECTICYEVMNKDGRHVVKFSPCGHSSCNICAEQINKCHLCRSNILDKITD